MTLCMYIALRQGQTTPWGQNFDVNRNILSFVASFKKLSLKSDFMQFFFMILYMYIAPGQGQTDTRGQSFDFNRNVLSLHSFVVSFQKMSLKSDFIQFFHDLLHIYSSGAVVDNPQGTKFWCQQKGLITLPICCRFQRNLFEEWFYTFFFHDLIHVYSPRAGGIQPPGEKVLMSTEISCHFGQLLLVSNHRLQYFLKNPLFYLFPIQKA